MLEAGSRPKSDGSAPPKVSVCVITHNHERFIAECLENILAQETTFAFEVIVADDLSSDSTRDIVREIAAAHPGVVRPLLPEEKLGAIETFLRLHDSARGEYVAHIDGDDLMYQGRLALQAKFLDEHSYCALVAHDVRILSRETGVVLSGTSLKVAVPEVVDLEFLVRHGCFFVHSSKMYRRSANRGLPRDRHVVDFFMHVYHASQGRIGFINQVLGAYRRGQGSISNVDSPYFEYVLHGHLAAYELARQFGVPAALIDRRSANFKYVHAMLALRQGDPEAFRSLIVLSEAESLRAPMRHRIVAALSRQSWLIWLIARCSDRLAITRPRT